VFTSDDRPSTRARRVAVTAAVVSSFFLTGSRSAPSSAASSATGRIEGSVQVGRQLLSRPSRLRLYPEPTQPPAPEQPASLTGELRNVVVYLEAAPPGASPSTPAKGPFLVQQKGLAFEPHVIAVPKGATVEFPNRDLVFHNVFSLSKASSFDLGRYPSGSAKSVRFDDPGLVRVFCHIHSDMAAVVLVLPNPFFTSPSENGRYSLDGVPPGEYRVVAWHERARILTKTIRVEAGKATSLDFAIPLSESREGG
jgi:plastocyanin